MRTQATNKAVEEDPRYHNTWKLLSKYRDVSWGMELSVAYLKNEFQIEYDCSIDDFLESIYLAGADLSGTQLEHHARCIERSNKMLTLLTKSVALIRSRHKCGEEYYWILYYSYLSPQKLSNVEEIIEQLRPHIRDISYRTFYRKRRCAVEALSNVLWGYTAKDSMDVLEQFFPSEAQKLKTGIAFLDKDQEVMK